MFLNTVTVFKPVSGDALIALIIMFILITLSALVSGSEVAFFSISKKDIDELEKENNPKSNKIITLLDNPKKLLATILIANNFINVAIVMFSSYVMDTLINDEAMSATLKFIIQVVLVTFIILLLGEIMPKVYATKNKIKLAKAMATPIYVIQKIIGGLSNLLVSSTSVIDKRITKKKETISVDDLEHALDLTKTSHDKDEKKILEGIVKFGQTDVKQIMTPRTDVIALDIETPYDQVLELIANERFSRYPVFKDTFDNIEGILYIKDLLPYLSETKEKSEWTKLIREAKFVPENKKIDDLLQDFQEEKKHIAIVVDEYGGSSGIVTLEDILEEIVGDITDEFDETDLVYSKLDDHTYIFEGKTPLKDMYRVLNIDGKEFEEAKGEADTVAGFCIEQAGKILLKNEKITFNNYTFTIESSDKRRIKQVKITKNEPVKTEE